MPIRYAGWEVPTAALEWVRANAREGSLDHEFTSENISDYNTVIVFLRDWGDGERIPFLEQIGLSPAALEETSDVSLAFVQSVHWSGAKGFTHVVFVHAGHFESRDSDCQSRLLLALIEKQDWLEPDRKPIKDAVTCEG